MATATFSRISIRAPKGAFRNEPFSDFTHDGVAKARMREALARVRSEFGREYNLVIGGEQIRTNGKIKSINPARPTEVVGIHQKAEAEHAEMAMNAALRAFESWKHVSAEERASLLFRAAEIVRGRKFEFMAWLVYEVGKNWGEADADVGETIDFLEFYGREALRFAKAEPPIQIAGEHDELRYIPLGVGAVISPWNFPFAIMAGMTSAAIVAGNTVIMKPSSDSPTIAARFVEVLEEAGMPEGVVNFCPGSGATFGNAIVEHPKTRFIAFTGSKEVGLDIHYRAAKAQPGQIWIKRTILEMGGKDSILVDVEADIEAAVEGVALSAFGFNGQKCSACSRAIVDERIYDVFVDRLRDRVSQMKQGDPAENYYLGPVVSEGAMRTILKYIEIGRGEGRVITGGGRAEGDGFFVQPTVIADVDPMARISQEEIFGPVLAVIPCRNFEHGLSICNNTEFGLTGSVYTNNRDKIEVAKREFHVGNLYINRKSTGAMVGAHPFGGFNMSGTDSKAGGPDYLYLFTQAKSIGEKLTPSAHPLSRGGN